MLLKKITKISLFLVLTFSGIQVCAQQTPAPKTPIVGSIEIEDSVSLAKKKIEKKVVSDKPKPKLKRFNDSFPNPRKALLWSIIPGGGQIYNNKALYIRLPIVYGALAFGINRIVVNNNLYSNLAYNHSIKVNNSNVQHPPFDTSIYTQAQLENSDASAIKQARDASFNSLELSYIFVGIGYLLSGLEAFTTAHLAHFDVKDDIKFSFKPSIIETPLSASGSVTGLSFVVTF